MQKDINKRKIKFFIVQVTVLVTAVFLTVLSLGIYSVRMKQAETKDDLEKTMTAFVDQLKNNQLPFPAVSVENFSVIIIDALTGDVLVDHKSAAPDGNMQELWEGHKAKIVYQMQKQEQGDVTYPERESWRIWQPVQLLRFSHIPELGWIVALETTLKPELALFREAYSPGNIFFILTLLAGAALFVWWDLTRKFNAIIKTITEALEKDIMAVTGDKVWENVKPPEAAFLSPEPEIDPEKDFKKSHESAIQAQPERTGDVFEEKIFSSSPPSFIRQALTKETVDKKPEKKETVKPSLSLGQDSKDLTIDIGSIQSDLLKKMIRELREE